MEWLGSSPHALRHLHPCAQGDTPLAFVSKMSAGREKPLDKLRLIR
jgi:hypothetical protein